MTTSETIRSSVTADGVVLMDVGTGQIFNSNAVGARIWLKLQEGLDIATMADQISAEFEVPPERVRLDVEDFIEKLRANGIVYGPPQE
jgi:hypothetical protein